jgi:hypothetical protein
VHLGYDGLREWWIQSPVLVTAVALLLLVLVPALLLWAIIRLWRGAERPRSHHEEDNEG